MSNQHIAILLCTYNGDRFLDEQLHSLAAQEVDRIDVWASDDGSSDTTHDILKTWAHRWTKGEFKILRGPGQGAPENFRSLMCLDEISADFVALCDQDDIWDQDKLFAAIQLLQHIPADLPSAYFSRTRLINETGRPLGYSPLIQRQPGFRNALVQSIGGANTMMLNRVGFDLARESARRTGFVSADWWCYMLVSGASGKVIYDPIPHISYRQHDANLIGANSGFKAQAVRLKEMMRGRFSEWNGINLEALERCDDLLSQEARGFIAQFKAVRSASLKERLILFKRMGLYRQTVFGFISLYLAVISGRV